MLTYLPCPFRGVFEIRLLFHVLSSVHLPPPIFTQVTERSKAALGDLRPGDVIISINGESTAEMLNVEAQNKIKQSSGQLQLQVDR